MDTVGRVALQTVRRSRTATSQNGSETVRFNRRNHYSGYADIPCFAYKRITIGGELQSIEMAVRVNQHGHRTTAVPSGFTSA